jgi:hypothetical protein
MEERKFEIIQELMDELQGLMSPEADEFAERLGREKPKVEMMSIEAEDPSMEDDEEMDEEMVEGSPEESLKNRLMKLRG